MGIRAGQPNISGCPSTTFECPDEDCDCPFTTWALCGMHATETTQTQQVNFLTCFDQNNIAYSNDWVPTMPLPNKSALHCVNQTNPSAYEAVVACGHGQKGQELKQEAADYFHKTFPMYWTGPVFDVPHLYINNVEQVISLNASDLWNFARVLCSDGANAPVCKALGENANKLVIV